MTDQPAARSAELPYARPYWDAAEESALIATLNSGMWTNGATVAEFECSLSELTGAPTIALSSGSAAVYALLSCYPSRGSGPRVLVSPTVNFVAGPASARLLGWDVALCDVRPDDLTLCPELLAELLATLQERYEQVLVLAVHYAGHTCDMAALSQVCARYGADLIEDACHAIGARYMDGSRVGSWPTSRAAYFSFHPTKPLASGEGGAVSSTDGELLQAIGRLRNHNMMVQPAAADDDYAARPYQIASPGMNLRLSELHAAVGLVQARRLPESQRLRAILAGRYYDELAGCDWVRPIPWSLRNGSAHHLFPVVFDLAALRITKSALIEAFTRRGIRPQVHYTPLHRLAAFGDVSAGAGSDFTVADEIFPGLLSLPLWRGMSESDQDRVLDVIKSLRQMAHRPKKS